MTARASAFLIDRETPLPLRAAAWDSFSPVSRGEIMRLRLGGRTPEREERPARGPACFGIGDDHLHVWPRQILPILDVFRVALAHEKADRRGVGRGIIGQFLLPARLDQPGVLDRGDVPGRAPR